MEISDQRIAALVEFVRKNQAVMNTTTSTLGVPASAALNASNAFLNTSILAISASVFAPSTSALGTGQQKPESSSTHQPMLPANITGGVYKGLSDNYERQDGSTAWFQSHLYCGGKDASEVTFFSAASGAARRDNALLKRLNDIFGAPESNMRVLHAMLFRHVSSEGMLQVDDFVECLKSLLTHTETPVSFVEAFFKRNSIVIDATKSVEYYDVMDAVDELFNGRKTKTEKDRDRDAVLVEREQQGDEAVESPLVSVRVRDGNDQTLQWCFDLCDITRNGYILLPVMKELRANQDESVLSFLIVKAVMRAFEKIASIEEERIRAALSKGKKKKKAAANVPMPTKRQFHICYEEFKTLMQRDPHFLVAFLPFAIKQSCSVESDVL